MAVQHRDGQVPRGSSYRGHRVRAREHHAEARCAGVSDCGAAGQPRVYLEIVPDEGKVIAGRELKRLYAIFALESEEKARAAA